MVSEPVLRTRSARWSPVLEHLRSDAMDCLQTNLAAHADDAHGAGSHLALGAPLRYPAVGRRDGEPSVGASLEERLEEARDLLGLTVAERWDGLDGPAVRRLAETVTPLYVVADTYTMGWVPYAGQRHLEHSVLVTRGGPSVTVVDGYHNDTPWGQARPGAWRVPAAAFDAAVPHATVLVLTAGPVPRLEPAAVLAHNAAAAAGAVPSIDRYLDGIRRAVATPEGLDRLVLDVWLLGRSRVLHAAWSATVHGVPAAARVDAAAQAQAWLTLTAQSYVAMRRARRGGGVPTAVVDEMARLLYGDVARVDGSDGPSATGAVDAARAAVLDALVSVLRVDAHALPGGTVLRDLPGFSSFRLLDVIEGAESRLGVELAPDHLEAGSLQDLKSLCALFARSVSLGVLR
jgi:hypothetical protein